jgi:hypothetical protein
MGGVTKTQTKQAGPSPAPEAPARAPAGLAEAMADTPLGRTAQTIRDSPVVQARAAATRAAFGAALDPPAGGPAWLAAATANSPLGRTARMIRDSPVMQARAAALRAAYGPALDPPPPVQRAAAPPSGLPGGLKAEVEARSGLAMDDVRVHRDSPEPAQVQALATARGTDIHLAPGQEQHLPHEAWHVVQQKQGRVAPTLAVNGVAVNDDPALEREADAMGAAARTRSADDAAVARSETGQHERERSSVPVMASPVSQRMLKNTGAETKETGVTPKTETTPTTSNTTTKPPNAFDALKPGLGAQVEEIRKRMTFKDRKDVLSKLDESDKKTLRERVLNTLTNLNIQIQHNRIGYTEAFQETIDALLKRTTNHRTNRYNPKGTAQAIIAREISEKLSELDYVAKVPQLAMPKWSASKVYMGIQGNKKIKADVDTINFEKVPFTLPAIDVDELEADVYYRDVGGVVHVVEVKNTVRALCEKLSKGKQSGRQIAWLKKRKGYKRVVEYFIQSSTGFDRALDPDVTNRFGEIEHAQYPKGQEWIQFENKRYTFENFKTLANKADILLGDKIRKLGIRRHETFQFVEHYFGTIGRAENSVNDPDSVKRLD